MVDTILEFDSRIINDIANINNLSTDLNLLKNISILTQNFNSLNLSTYDSNHFNVNKFTSKLAQTLKHKSDIFLIQDLRLKGKYNILNKELSCTKYGNYEAFVNSKTKNRGCAILIKRDLNFKVVKRYDSKCDNVLLLDIVINNVRLTLGSIYAPKQDLHRDFFDNLRNKIRSIDNKTYFFGGDFNSVANITNANLSPSLGNIDTLNMSVLPNPIHCKFLHEWVNKGEVADLFRLVNPNRIEFSYVPYQKKVRRPNRSRIDHLFVSIDLIDIFDRCDFIEGKSSLFDHKALRAISSIKKPNLHKNVDSTLLDLDGLFDSVKFDVYSLILDHFDIPDKEILRGALRNINIHYKNFLNLDTCYHKNDAIIRELRRYSLDQIDYLCSRFPSINDCYSFPCNVDPKAFLETLGNTLKNSTIAFQSSYIDKQRSEKKKITIELNNLKKITSWQDRNFERIEELENKLSNIEDREIARSFESFKHHQIVNFEKPTRAYSKLIKNSNKKRVHKSYQKL